MHTEEDENARSEIEWFATLALQKESQRAPAGVGVSRDIAWGLSASINVY